MSDTDEAGLAALCAGERQRLVRLLALHVGDPGVAEELVHDALVQLVAKWPRVRDMDSPRAWLTSVAMNLANSWYRRRYAELRANRRHGVAGVVSAPNVAEVLAVRDALAALPRRQRTAILLRYYEELSVRDTARVMDCPEGTVKALTHRGIQHLRDKGRLAIDDDIGRDATVHVARTRPRTKEMRP